MKKKFKVNINTNLYKPDNLVEKPEYRINRQGEYHYGRVIRKYKKKWNKRIRNMGYRYI